MESYCIKTADEMSPSPEDLVSIIRDILNLDALFIDEREAPIELPRHKVSETRAKADEVFKHRTKKEFDEAVYRRIHGLPPLQRMMAEFKDDERHRSKKGGKKSNKSRKKSAKGRYDTGYDFHEEKPKSGGKKAMASADKFAQKNWKIAQKAASSNEFDMDFKIT